MTLTPVQTGRTFITRLPHRADLLQTLQAIAADNALHCARLEVIGAVSRARIGYYDQVSRQYQTIEIPHPMEITCCIGTISRRDFLPFVHAHITLGQRDGRTCGGHLFDGTVIFAAECVITELSGVTLDRLFDEETGLALWPR